MEQRLLMRAGKKLNRVLSPETIGMSEGRTIKVDGFCQSPPTLLEAWAHVGKPKGGQISKPLADAMKMMLAEKLLVNEGRDKAWQKVLAFGDEEAAAPFREKTWRARALEEMGFVTLVLPFTPTEREEVRRAQRRQRFQRHRVDSLWQMDVYEFRIAGVGRVYVVTILDDRSRYLVMARAYTRKRAAEAVNALWWALRNGRRPKAVYVDNGTCFIARDFKRFCGKQGIRIIYGRPYNPRGRGKLERFHKVLFLELIAQVRFRSLPHFRRELWLFRRSYNRERLHGGIDWRTPHEVYHDRRLMRRQRIPRG